MLRYLLPLFLIAPLAATEHNPWFSPPWEFQGRASYFYDHENFVQSPQGNFKAPSNDYTFHFSLGVTPWPCWNVEAEVFLTHASDIPFSYEASFFSLRYQWWDDITGDLFSLVTGVTFSFPGERYLSDFSFVYHGNANMLLHATLGKEFTRCCDDVWLTRVWAMGGWGIAERGNAWLHGLGAWEVKLSRCLEWGIFSDMAYGMGPNDLFEDEPFTGYRSVAYRKVDLGTFVNYEFECVGTLTILGAYNVYARNFLENTWSFIVSMLIPFSL